MRHRLLPFSTGCLAAVILSGVVAAQAPPAASAKIWIDKSAEIEAFLKSAEVIGMEELKVGVTKPRRAKLAPGGPVDAMAWKPIRPGRYTGSWESYKSEIAAYELDKVLGLGMVPPTVERRYDRETGSLQLWVGLGGYF